ncbi:MAG: hypothetical protein QGH83_16270, partial [Candidatus Pacebacteria bacterium]|nr:hypothetical protein [Candidatus Paceibacterota bacterium]
VLAEDRKTEFAMSQQLHQAQNALSVANAKVFWAKMVHGEGSKEHQLATQEYNDRKLAVEDATLALADQTKLRTENEAARAELRTEIDREHRTTMGNVRLFFKGETDWQRNMGKQWRSFTGSLGQMFKDYIYDPGSSGGPPGTGTPMRIFGIELKWPEFDIPSWGDIKESLPAWLKAEWWTTKWDGWMMALPTWSDILASIPKWLGGTKEGTSSWSELLDFSNWTLPEFPTWETIKAWMPKWMTDPVGWIKGIFKKGDKSADIEEKIKEGTEKKAALEDQKASVRLSAEDQRASISAKADKLRKQLTDSRKPISSAQEYKLKEDLLMAQKKKARLEERGETTGNRLYVSASKKVRELEDKLGISQAKELAEIDVQEQAELARITSNETARMAELDVESLTLQQEQTELERKLASLVNNSVPHIKVMSIVDPADKGSTAEAAKALQRAAPQDFDATVTISTTGTPGGAAPVIVNNVSNNSSGGSTSAPTNNYVNITANATDPYTSKQPNLAYKRY